MGISDVVHDNIYTLLDEITSYSYFKDHTDDILNIIAEHLKLIHKLDCVDDPPAIDYKDWAKKKYCEYFLGKF